MEGNARGDGLRTRHRPWRNALVALLAALAALAVGPIAEAHPHVSIKVRTLLLVQGGALTGLHHIWVMDQGWLASQLEQHDKDGDGKLSAEELVELTAESKATLEMFKAFTTIRHGGIRIRPGVPQSLSIEYFADRLGLSFVVPLPKPIPLAGAELLLEVYDATYFSGFAFDGERAVDVAGTGEEGCRVALAPASPQQLAAYRLVKAQMGIEFTDPGPPKAMSVSCDKVGFSSRDHVPVSVR